LRGKSRPWVVVWSSLSLSRRGQRYLSENRRFQRSNTTNRKTDSMAEESAKPRQVESPKPGEANGAVLSAEGMSSQFQRMVEISLGGVHGLTLRGIVIGQEDKPFTDDQNKTVNRRIFAVTDGQRSYQLTASDKMVALPVIPQFSAISVRVSYARTEKGITSVQGEIEVLN